MIPVGPLRPLAKVLTDPADDIFAMVPFPKLVTYKFPAPSMVRYCGLFNPVAKVVSVYVVSYVNIGPVADWLLADTLTVPVPHKDGTVTCN